MTKPITAIALMMLYEEGKFKLTDPLSKYIPSFAEMSLFDYEANKDIAPNDLFLKNIKTKPCNNPILIQHVLSHTSGLSYSFDASGKMEPVDKLYLNEFDFHQDRNAKLSDLVDHQLSKMPLCFEPGTRFNYSYSSDVCGRLVEIISGMPLDEFFHQ